MTLDDNARKLFSNEGLLTLHTAVRTSLAIDDSLPNDRKIYGVREFRDWKVWCETLEAELIDRDVPFQKVIW